MPFFFCFAIPGRSWDGETVVKQANWDVSVPRYRQAALPERITKNILRRAVDVNRPVTSLVRSWCGSGRADTHRYQWINIPRSPCHVGMAHRETQNITSDVLTTVSPSRDAAPGVLLQLNHTAKNINCPRNAAVICDQRSGLVMGPSSRNEAMPDPWAQSTRSKVCGSVKMRRTLMPSFG